MTPALAAADELDPPCHARLAGLRINQARPRDRDDLLRFGKATNAELTDDLVARAVLATAGMTNENERRPRPPSGGDTEQRRDVTEVVRISETGKDDVERRTIVPLGQERHASKRGLLGF